MYGSLCGLAASGSPSISLMTKSLIGVRQFRVSDMSRVHQPPSSCCFAHSIAMSDSRVSLGTISGRNDGGPIRSTARSRSAAPSPQGTSSSARSVPAVPYPSAWPASPGPRRWPAPRAGSVRSRSSHKGSRPRLACTLPPPWLACCRSMLLKRPIRVVGELPGDMPVPLHEARCTPHGSFGEGIVGDAVDLPRGRQLVLNPSDDSAVDLLLGLTEPRRERGSVEHVGPRRVAGQTGPLAHPGHGPVVKILRGGADRLRAKLWTFGSSPLGRGIRISPESYCRVGLGRGFAAVFGGSCTRD